MKTNNETRQHTLASHEGTLHQQLLPGYGREGRSPLQGSGKAFPDGET